MDGVSENRSGKLTLKKECRGSEGIPSAMS